MEFSSLKIKNLKKGILRDLKIEKSHSEKISYISGNGTF